MLLVYSYFCIHIVHVKWSSSCNDRERWIFARCRSNLDFMKPNANRKPNTEPKCQTGYDTTSCIQCTVGRELIKSEEKKEQKMKELVLLLIIASAATEIKTSTQLSNNSTSTMGAMSSKVYVTDWDKADGHLHYDETVDHMAPFKQHETLILSHEGQREFKVSKQGGRDEELYTTKAVPKTAFWFDVCRAGEKILQVRGHPWGTVWDIFAYRVPAYEGQEAVLDENASLQPLHLKARVTLNWKQDGAQVKMCQGTGENGKIKWSEPVLIYDDINYACGKGQTHLPSDNNLVSYFELSSKHQPSKLELAKGCDIALHIILAVISNVIHCNTNPFLVHATDADDISHGHMFGSTA